MSDWKIPYDMFDLERTAEEARRADKLRGIYHRGQDLAWDGRRLLREAVEKYGGVKLESPKREALGRLMSLLMWGELAAWRISAQLADSIETLEPKMAATSQAHDEARHFHVFYDYLKLLGIPPHRAHGAGRRLLEAVLQEEDLTHKLVGMQLMIETTALTIFQSLRESRVEPVLADLLVLVEKDEARHVGLGIQYLPDRLKGLGYWGYCRLTKFQLQMVYWTVASLRASARDLYTLGIEPRDVIRLGKGKQQMVNDAMWAELGITYRPIECGISKVVDSVMEAMFPPDGKRAGLRERASAARKVWRKGISVRQSEIGV